MCILFDRSFHLLGEPHYEVDCTLLAAHGRFMFLTEPAFPTSAVQGCTNVPYRDMYKCRGLMDEQERPAIAGGKRAAMWVACVALGCLLQAQLYHLRPCRRTSSI